MKVEISVPEVVNIFKEIQEQPDRIFDMIRVEIRESVGEYLSRLMDTELTRFLGLEWYEHAQGDVNHRNGSHGRNFRLKGIGQVEVEVQRDRKGKFKTQVIPRSKRYEDELRQDLSFMFLTGISTRSLSMISTTLIGRKISPTEVSNANKRRSSLRLKSKGARYTWPVLFWPRCPKNGTTLEIKPHRKSG